MQSLADRWTRSALVAVFTACALGWVGCGGDDDSSTAASGNGGDSSHRWVLVTSQAGLGDQGFVDLAYAGIKQAAKELGGRADVIQSTEQAQYVPNLQQSADSGGTLTYAAGFPLTDAVVEVAKQKPDASFALIDAEAIDKATGKLYGGANVASVLFKDEEGGFLAGLVAGKTTKTDKIGFVGGIEVPSVTEFLAGFRAGVKTANPKAEVRAAYAGSFNDPQKGQELANSFYETGSDIVVEKGGGSGTGVFKAAKSRDGVRVIGTDTCEPKRKLAPEAFLTSSFKNTQAAVFEIAKRVDAGSFEGGIIRLGAKEGTEGVCRDESFTALPQDVQELVDRYQEMIESGELKVPTTDAEVRSFEAPSG